MNNFFVLTTDNTLPIENIENLNTGNVLLQANEDLDGAYIYIVNKDNYSLYANKLTIGDHEECDIVLINDNNIQEFMTKNLKNVYLFVNDLNKFITNFSILFKQVAGFIELKFKDINQYNIDELTEALGKISSLVLLAEQEGFNCCVKNLNGWKIKEKFNSFGENSFFIDTQGNIYVHPSFYYQKKSPLGCVEKNKIEDIKQVTKPHLVCLMCETFYCDRNIYLNKLKTNEYLVPCSSTCKLTTILSNYSKEILNTAMNQTIFSSENLDKVNDFSVEEMYPLFLANKCLCNMIKEIDYSQRKMKGDELLNQ